MKDLYQKMEEVELMFQGARNSLMAWPKGSISLGCACLRQIANARRKLVPN